LSPFWFAGVVPAAPACAAGGAVSGTSKRATGPMNAYGRAADFTARPADARFTHATGSPNAPFPGTRGTPVRARTERERLALASFRQLGAGLGPEPTAEELKRAFRDLARRYHPDVHPTLSARERRPLETRFAAVVNAYRTLMPTIRASEARDRT
jgi:hypothetical protein